MSLPTQEQLHHAVDEQLRAENPDAPYFIDEHDTAHEEIYARWCELRDHLAREWANREFVERFPDAGYIDGSSEYFPYWEDMYNHIRDNAPTQWDWNGVQVNVTVEGDTPTDGQIARHDQQVEREMDKRQDVLNAGLIFDTQKGIVEVWDHALELFVDRLDARADSATPDFLGAVRGHVEDKIMGAIVSRGDMIVQVFLENAAVSGEIAELLGVLFGEAKRAVAAAEAATVRAFYDSHKKQLSNMLDDLVDRKPEFVRLVDNVCRTAVEHPYDDAIQATYRAVHHEIQLLVEDVEGRSKVSDIDLFLAFLNKQWIEQMKRAAAAGVDEDVEVVIRIESDGSVRDASLSGQRAAQILEGLKRDFPSGVDLFGLPVPRRVAMMAEKGSDGTMAVVRYDAEGTFLAPMGTDGHWENLRDAIAGFGDGWAATPNVHVR